MEPSTAEDSPTPIAPGLLTPPATCSKPTPLTTKNHAPAATPSSPLTGAQTRRREPSISPSTALNASSTVAGFAGSSHRHQAGSAEYLARLLQLAQSDRANRQNFKPAMADFLSSFNLGAQSPAPSNNLSCNSVQDIQLHLRGVLNSKVTPNRAEHVSVTLELKSTVRFTLVLSESENGQLENLNNIDPTLGGTRSTPLPMEHNGGQLSRVVEANETLMNQPQDDPALQRSVAKHIVTALSATDGSTWIVREVSRGTQGWTFTYLCKDSCRQWSRQNAKTTSKAIVGEYSEREPDEFLHGRPAFDCRGLVVVAFDRGSRSIVVKYDHTPLHKTVSELVEYFKPPPRVLGPGAQRALQPKTPKKSEKKTGEKKKGEKKKRESTRAQDENGNPRKKRKKKSDAQNEPPPDGPVMPPDYPGAQPINGQGEPSYGNGQFPSTNGEENPQAFGDYPQGLMEGEAPTNNVTQQQTSAQATAAAAAAALPINVTPAEAARRKEVATALLTKNGVPPETLSAEQFNIFSNQSPDLQKESLNMLVKYGAERLRIVHPSNREGSASAASTTNTTSSQSSQPTPTGPTTTKELVPQSAAKSAKASPRVAAGQDGGSAGAASTPSKAKRGQGKSPLACSSCKSRKVKCPRERPICQECLTEGFNCEYAPQKARSKKSKSDAIVVEDDDEDDDATEENTQLEDPKEQNAAQQETQDYSSYGQMPVADMLTPSVEHPPRETAPQSNYFQTASGLTLPQAELTSIPQDTSHGNSYRAGVPQATQSYEQQPVQAQSQPVTSPVQTKRSARGSAAASRRSLPSAPAHNGSPSMAVVNPTHTSGWAAANVPMPSAAAPTISPQLSQATTTRRGTRQSNNRMSTDTTFGMQQAQALSQAALYQQPQTDLHQLRDTSQKATNPQATMAPHHSPTVVAAVQAAHRTSPFQLGDIPRANSRQSQRTQNRTPVSNQSASQAYQPPPELNRPANPSNSTARQAPSQTSNLSGYNDYGQYSSANTTSHQSTQQPSYDTYSQQRTSSNAAPAARSSGQPSRNAAIARSMASQPASSMANSYPSNTSTSNQWSGSQSHNTRSYTNNTPSYNANANVPYSQPPSSSSAAPASLQSFNMRSNSAQQPSRSDTSYDQQQQQGYSGYSSQGTNQQTQQNQSSNQHPNWYFNNSSNTSSFTPTNQSSQYSWKMPDEPWSNV